MKVFEFTAVFTLLIQIGDLQHQFLDWSSFFKKIIGLEEFQDNLFEGVIKCSHKDVRRIRSIAYQSFSCAGKA